MTNPPKETQARAIIDEYALSHARAAFVAGQLGGQFGLDRIPLTALTIAMIVRLCKLYDVKDPQAKAVHIGWAISRLTFRGTVLAQTALNWVPIAGPLANSSVTYFLTKQAGWDCVRDIVNNRMTVAGQTEKAVRQGVTTFGAELIGNSAHDLGSDIVDGVVGNTQLLLTGTEALSGTLATLDHFLRSEALTAPAKVFVGGLVNAISRDIVEGKPVSMRERLLDAALLGVAAGVITGEIADSSFELSETRRERLEALIARREQSPGAFRMFLDQQVDRLVEAGTKEAREATLRNIVESIDEMVGMVRGTAENEQTKERILGNPKRILVFGTVGAGKTSLCNAVTDETDPQRVSNSAKGVTFESYTYAPFEVAGSSFIFTDTVGLNESDRGTVPRKEALKALVGLLKDSSDGYNLLIHVMRIPRVTKAEQDNYEFFVKTIADSRIPVILVATGCENIEPMSTWGEENAAAFREMQLEYADIICTSFARGGRFESEYQSLRAESASAVHAAIDKFSAAEPILIYNADAGFVQVLKRAWNWFCGWLGIDKWTVGINEQIRTFLERLGFSSGEAKQLAEAWTYRAK